MLGLLRRPIWARVPFWHATLHLSRLIYEGTYLRVGHTNLILNFRRVTNPLPADFRALWINLPGVLAISSLCFMIGVVMFAFYADCHPQGIISKRDQVGVLSGSDKDEHFLFIGSREPYAVIAGPLLIGDVVE
jgi:hypothetical protein